ncbi:MAG: C1 family peptidase [Pseudomonadota bacterium]
MGIALPPERKVVDPPVPTPPEPGPAPGPGPAPEPAEDEDSFFDDDFFDEDQSFDEVVNAMDAEFDKTVAAWDKEYEETIARWDEARETYLQREDAYRAGTVPLTGAAENLTSGGNFTVNLRSMQPGEFHVIPGALDLEVKDQAARGTCTAFAGVRALESLLLQQGILSDFSEEHFYFLSKPDCWTTPCGKNREGGSVDGGLKATRNERVGGLMLEQQCPYVPTTSSGNITNSPLSTCQGPGLVRAGNLVDLRSHADILNELRNNRPVVVGFTLSKSYYANRGVVRLHDPVNETAAEGRDAGGHANLLVGYVRLPDSMSREGQYCLITANSWTDGWGRGGHACLTETWLREHVSVAAAVRSITLTEQGLARFGL